MNDYMHFEHQWHDLVDSDLMAYCPRRALALGELAVGVYQDTMDFRMSCAAAGYTSADIIDVGATQIGWAYRSDNLVFAPRGTSSVLDFVEDLRVLRRRWPYGKGSVHAGFRRQTLRAVEHVRATLRELQPTTIYVGGHSLGGAVAVLLRSYLAHVEATHVPSWWAACQSTYTFEAPRVGDEDFANYYDRHFHRSTFNVAVVEDGVLSPVTRAPKRAWGYRHVDRRVIVQDGQEPFEDDLLLSRWHDLRRQNPVGHLAAWRILSRARASVRAHRGQNLLKILRADARRV